MRNSTQAKKGKVFHCTKDNLRPAITVIREGKNHISNEPSVHFNLANMLGRQKKTGEKVFCLQMQIKLKSCVTLLS